MTSRCENDELRVVVQQPALPAYRVPVFAELARRCGLQVHVVHGQMPELPEAAPEGFQATAWPLRRLSLPGRTLLWHHAQWSFATRTRADVLVLSWNLNCASLVPALLRARAEKVGTVLWGHGYAKNEASWRRWARVAASRLGDALLLYNHSTARMLIERGEDAGRIFVALNTLDQAPIRAAREEWSAEPERLARFRRDSGLGAGPVVLFVSRLEQANRVDLLIRAAATLVTSHPRLTVAIIGAGPERPALLELAESLGLTSVIRFLGPIYAEQQLAPWFLSADAFCYPANVGLSLNHAFAYGLPVVTSDRIAAQNPEIEALETEVNGLLYAHGDVDALAAALRRMLEDSPFRRATADAARRTAEQRLTLEGMVDGMEQAVRYAAATAATRRGRG